MYISFFVNISKLIVEKTLHFYKFYRNTPKDDKPF